MAKQMADPDIVIHLEYCPFCGETENLWVKLAQPPFMLKKYRGKYAFAGCKSCGATTKLFRANNKTGSPLQNEANTIRAFYEAAEAWNRRR